MANCCAWHRSGGHELMVCDDRDAQALRAQGAATLLPSNELAKLRAERDEAVGALARRTAAWVSLGIERDRLRAALEPTAETIEELRRDLQHGLDELKDCGGGCFAGEVENVARNLWAFFAGIVHAHATTDLEAAVVNRDRLDGSGAQALSTGAAAAPTGQAGGEQSSPAGPPAGVKTPIGCLCYHAPEQHRENHGPNDWGACYEYECECPGTRLSGGSRR